MRVSTGIQRGRSEPSVGPRGGGAYMAVRAPRDGVVGVHWIAAVAILALSSCSSAGDEPVGTNASAVTQAGGAQPQG